MEKHPFILIIFLLLSFNKSVKLLWIKANIIIKISYLFYFSPEWRPENAIWIGASDTKQEGRFAWTDKSPMDYKSKQQFKT